MRGPFYDLESILVAGVQCQNTTLKFNIPHREASVGPSCQRVTVGALMTPNGRGQGYVSSGTMQLVAIQDAGTTTQQYPWPIISPLDGQ